MNGQFVTPNATIVNTTRGIQCAMARIKHSAGGFVDLPMLFAYANGLIMYTKPPSAYAGSQFVDNIVGFVTAKSRDVSL